MKILLTFEYGGIALHFIDVIRMLKHRGHEIDYYDVGSIKLPVDYQSHFGNTISVLNNTPDFDDYDLWLYDLTSWETPTSPLITYLENFKGTLVCICNGDGAGFLIERVSMKVVEKTKVFMRNTLFLDKNLYHPAIWNKLFISTCYISNSQDFKNILVSFEQKHKRAIFTGSLTGFSEDGNLERHLCRIKVPMALISAGIPCVYRLHNHNPQWKDLFTTNVPQQYIASPFAREDFIRETAESMIVLSLRGNYHTVNRFYEGLAAGSLVFSTKFRDAAEFYGHGDPGVHYVEIEWDGSDVVEKVRYYFAHTEEARIIASNGRKLWEEYSMLDENKLLPPKVIDYYVVGLKAIGNIDI